MNNGGDWSYKGLGWVGRNFEEGMRGFGDLGFWGFAVFF